MARARTRAGVAWAVLAAAGLGGRATAGDGEIAARTWVLARRPALTLKVGAEPVAAGKGRSLYRVDRVQGGWLWLVGGSTKGWAKASDVVPLDQAEALFAAEIDRHPDPWLHLQRAAVRLKHHDAAGAFADADAALRLDPKSAAAFRLRGWARIGRREYPEALADFNEAVELDPKDPEGYIGRARARLFTRDSDGALADCEEAIRLDPKDADGVLARARCLIGKGDSAHVLADFDAALRLDPNWAEPYSLRGFYWQTRRDIGRAAADFEEAIRLDPTDAPAYTGRAATRRSHGDLAGARADMDAAIRLTPKDARLYAMRASDRRERGDIDGALADLDECIRLNPKDPLAYRQRARLRGARKDFDGAIADDTEALRLGEALGPVFRSMSLQSRARTLRAAGRRDEAWDDLVASIRLRPGWPADMCNGFIWDDAKDPDRAIPDFDALIRRLPDYPFAFVGRARAFARKGDGEHARADFEQAIRLAPKDATIFLHRGLSRLEGGDLDGALADLDESIRLNPNSNGPYFDRAEVWLKRGSDRRALLDLDTAIRLNPHMIGALHMRAWLKCVGNDQTLHDYPGALADATRACELARYKDPEELSLLAYASFMVGKPQQAIQWQTKALELLPKDSPRRPDFEKTLQDFRTMTPPR